MAETKKYDLSGPEGPIVFRGLQTGTKLRLTTGAVGEITGNPGDGAFVVVKILEHPEDESQVGQEQPVFFMDVREVVE